MDGCGVERGCGGVAEGWVWDCWVDGGVEQGEWMSSVLSALAGVFYFAKDTVEGQGWVPMAQAPSREEQGRNKGWDAEAGRADGTVARIGCGGFMPSPAGRRFRTSAGAECGPSGQLMQKNTWNVHGCPLVTTATLYHVCK
jgi:hypothetical protein